MQIFHCDQWSGQVVTVADALDQSRFGREPCCRMEEADNAFNTWELVDVVNFFLW